MKRKSIEIQLNAKFDGMEEAQLRMQRVSTAMTNLNESFVQAQKAMKEFNEVTVNVSVQTDIVQKKGGWRTWPRQMSYFFRRLARRSGSQTWHK